MGKRGPKPRITVVDPSKAKIDVFVEKIRARLYASWERNVERVLDQLDTLLVADEKPAKQSTARKARTQPPIKPPAPIPAAPRGKTKKGRSCGCGPVGRHRRECKQGSTSVGKPPASDSEDEATAPQRITRNLQATYDMITRAQAGDQAAMTELVRQNIGLVHWVARRHAWSSVPYEDMVQEGLIGLVEAIRRFDVSRGLKLTTFAPHWIKHFVTRAHENDGLIRLPVASHHQLQLVRRAQRKAGPDAPIDEIATRAGIRAKSVQRLLDRGTVTQPATLPDVAAPADDGDEERVTMAREHIAALPERLRRVMELRYSGDDGMTLLEVGNVVGVSRERVRQLETAALKVLRAKFAADEQSALEVA
jgi:RNA polymerase sigma factor (sigma-70 family)